MPPSSSVFVPPAKMVGPVYGFAFRKPYAPEPPLKKLIEPWPLTCVITPPKLVAPVSGPKMSAAGLALVFVNVPALPCSAAPSPRVPCANCEVPFRSIEVPGARISN